MTDDRRARAWFAAVDDASRKVAGVSDYGLTLYQQAFRLGAWLRFDPYASATDATAALLSAAAGNGQDDNANAAHVTRGLATGRAEGSCPDLLTRLQSDDWRNVAELRHAVRETLATTPLRPVRTGHVPTSPHPMTTSAPAKVPPDVASFWSHCRPFNDDPDVVFWLARRCKVDPVRLSVLTDLVRLTPTRESVASSFRWPTFATFGKRAWSLTGHRVIVPAFNASGALVGLRARLPVDGAAGDTPKELTPVGGAVKGTTLADQRGRRLLTGELTTVDGPVVIVEGVTDFLACVAADLTRPGGPVTGAIFGTYSGAWTADLAARVPDGAVVKVGTDADDAGERYWFKIHATFAGRCDLRRVRPGVRQ
jgi:hypothetical protein